MELSERVAETRKALTDKGNEILDTLQTRKDELKDQADQLKTRGEELLENRVQTPVAEASEAVQTRADELKQQAEDAIDTGRGRFVVMEARALEQARELLGRAGAILGERAPLVAKAELALTDALVQIRAQHEMGLPVEDFGELSIKKVTPFLADLDAEDLRVLRAYEAEHKNRVTLLRAIDKKLDELMES